MKNHVISDTTLSQKTLQYHLMPRTIIPLFKFNKPITSHKLGPPPQGKVGWSRPKLPFEPNQSEPFLPHHESNKNLEKAYSIKL